jgi:hypothetical protein
VHDHPEPFLETVIHVVEPVPGLTGLDAGYETGAWRTDHLARHLIGWLPEFALSYSEYSSLTHADAVEKIRRAAYAVYTTEKSEHRGEFGELLLHIAIRQTFKTVPAISKIFYKDAANNTVKGFDAVHVIASPDTLELWLGEAKFYEDAKAAIASVVGEIAKHTTADYLKGEFLLIGNKIDPAWPHAQRLKKLLNPNTSLDEVFDAACIPVLLTYDSAVLAAHTAKSKAFAEELTAELKLHHEAFCKALNCKWRVHLFLVPLCTKKLLVAALDEKLKAWQKLSQPRTSATS